MYCPSKWTVILWVSRNDLAESSLNNNLNKVILFSQKKIMSIWELENLVLGRKRNRSSVVCVCNPYSMRPSAINNGMTSLLFSMTFWIYTWQSFWYGEYLNLFLDLFLCQYQLNWWIKSMNGWWQVMKLSARSCITPLRYDIL